MFGHVRLHVLDPVIDFFEFEEALVALRFALFRFKAKLLVDLVVS